MLDIFIDGEYYNAIQWHFRLFFDFPKFLEAMRATLSDRAGADLTLSHAFYYDCLPWLDTPYSQEDQAKYSKRLSFFNYLETLRGVKVRKGYLAKTSLGYQQKQVDMLIGLDIARESAKGLVSHMALVSGDGDLVPAVETASGHSVQVWLFYIPVACSDLLWSAADGRCEIDREFAEKVSRGSLIPNGAETAR